MHLDTHVYERNVFGVRREVLLAVAGYYLIGGLILFFLSSLQPGVVSQHLGVLHWDALHYQAISQHGYEGTNPAFFPLFPVTWGLLSLEAAAVSVLNGIVFLVSFLFLMAALRSTWKEVLFYLCIPGFIFFYLPFTESFFAAGSVLLLVGMMKKNVPLVCAGLFIMNMTRPVFAVVTVALLLTEWMYEKDRRLMLRKLLLYGCSVAAALFAVAAIQYTGTGKWFVFVEAQQGWGHKLQWPHLPMSSWAGGHIVKLDGSAMLAGLVSGVLLVMVMINVLRREVIALPKEVVFSLAYLCGMTLTVVFFKGGGLQSLNRYLFATAFFIVPLSYFLRETIPFSARKMLLAFLLLNACWLLLGSYVHIQTLLGFQLLTLYWMFYPALQIRSARPYVFGLLLILNFTLQLYLMMRFLRGEWVG